MRGLPTARSTGKYTSLMKNSVTIVITVWKRPYLREQLQSLVEQSAVPGDIWIILYEDHLDVYPVVREFRSVLPSIHVIKCDMNLKYFGRFSIASHVKSEYLWILDDDIIPGRGWLETARSKCEALNAVIGCSGRIIPKGDFFPEKCSNGDPLTYFIGDCHEDAKMNYCSEDTMVDYACNSYFFKTAWIGDFWAIWPSTFDSGEDIHLSAALKIRKNIMTIVPRQCSAETSGNLKIDYGRDENASWLKSGFYDIREKVLRNMILVEGWKPILWQ